MLLPILTIVLAAIALLAIWANRGDVSAPSVLFSGGFVFCSAWALAYAVKWSYTMHFEAFAVIAGGVALFALACLATRKLLFHAGEWRGSDQVWNGETPTPLVVIFVVLQVVVGVWFALRVRQMYPAGSIAASIAAYKYAATFTDDSTYLGFPLNPLRLFCLSAAYVVGYIFAYRVSGGQRDKLTLACAASCFVNLILNWEGGGRTGIAVYAVYVATIYLAALKGHHEGRLVISRRFVVTVLVVGVVFVGAFQMLAIGRHGGFSIQGTLDNLSAYCGAEIPNLDIWLRSGREQANDVWGSMTFIRTFTYLGPKLGIEAWTYPLDLPNVYSGWQWLGNVYTTFYAYIYDFGMVGLVVLTLIMGTISEAIYCMCMRATKFRDLWMMLYGYLAPQLLLSFFSNKFYEEFLAVGFLRVVAVVVVVRAALVFANRLPKASSVVPKHLPKHLPTKNSVEQ